MSQRTLGWVLACGLTITMGGCLAVAAEQSDRAAAHTSVSAGPSASSPGRPPTTPAPRPTKARPSPSPSASRRKTPPTPVPPSQITAASLGIPSAGTLKIPAWPSQSGMRYRGPDGSEGSTGTTSVALTFDDGPGPYTAQILDILEQAHVKATFCLIGRQIHAYQSVVRRMIDDGMTLCNHSWDHDEKLGTHTPQYIAANLQKTIDAVHRIDPSATMAYFRNPGGNFTPTTVRVSELLGMRPLYWSVDTNDWRRPGVPAIEKTVLTKTHRSSIVLMHDAGGDRTETIAALRAVLPELKDDLHLIALPTARTVAVDPGKPAPSPAPTSSGAPTDGDAPDRR
ncbi:MAG TPA: polysaccharide deacetylase family protein [Micromonosporaceae bacterium]|nr:polysaccharide deacetylase family protein [Micromonosporaceae bacterium]